MEAGSDQSVQSSSKNSCSKFLEKIPFVGHFILTGPCYKDQPPLEHFGSIDLIDNCRIANNDQIYMHSTYVGSPATYKWNQSSCFLIPNRRNWSSCTWTSNSLLQENTNSYWSMASEAKKINVGASTRAGFRDLSPTRIYQFRLVWPYRWWSTSFITIELWWILYLANMEDAQSCLSQLALKLCICWKQSFVLIEARIPIDVFVFIDNCRYSTMQKYDIPFLLWHSSCCIWSFRSRTYIQCFFHAPATWLLPHCTLLLSFIGHRLVSYEMPQIFAFEVDCSRPLHLLFTGIWCTQVLCVIVLENIPINKQIYAWTHNWARHISSCCAMRSCVFCPGHKWLVSLAVYFFWSRLVCIEEMLYPQKL